MIDLDHFKAVNDNNGHHVGDIVLREAASVIQSNIRTIDTFGRYGGEEFVLIMPSACIDDGLGLAQRLCNKIAEYNFTHDIKMTCSMGVAEYVNGELAADFLKRADEALYTAKENGRNRAVKYTEN